MNIYPCNNRAIKAKCMWKSVRIVSVPAPTAAVKHSAAT